MADFTEVDLYRSCRVEQFPNGLVLDTNEPAPGLLYPDFYDRPTPNGQLRLADVKIETDSNGVEWVMAGGGTSLFDRPNVFVRDGWLSFKIPDGTPVPAPLAVNKGEYNKRFKAWHYQIEVRTGRVQKTVLQGALDNFARSSLARFVEQAKASQS
jgi:hypothetical protein